MAGETGCRFIIDEPPLTVMPTLGRVFGLNKALVLQQIKYYSNPEFSFVTEADGRIWVRNSAERWRSKHFPFWSIKTIERLLKSLVDDGFLLRSNRNRQKYDRTWWYAIDFAAVNRHIDHVLNLGESSGQSVRIEPDKVTGSQPDKVSEPILEETEESKEEAFRAGARDGAGAAGSGVRNPYLNGSDEASGSGGSGQEDQPAGAALSGAEKRAALKRAEELFAEVTGLPLAKRGNEKQRKAASTRWWQPLTGMLEFVEYDAELFESALRKAVRKMRDDALTLSAPQSVESVFMDLVATGRARDISGGFRVKVDPETGLF